jgi:hypothetical protein
VLHVLGEQWYQLFNRVFEDDNEFSRKFFLETLGCSFDGRDDPTQSFHVIWWASFNLLEKPGHGPLENLIAFRLFHIVEIACKHTKHGVKVSSLLMPQPDVVVKLSLLY